MAEEKKSSNKTVIIILIVVIVLLLVGGAVFFVINANKKPEESGQLTSDGTIPYEVNAQIMGSSPNWNDSILQDAQEALIPMHFSAGAESKDGENFTCTLGNPPGALYDMYYDMYSDSTLSEQIYLSGLVAPGQEITQFKTNRKFPKGETNVVLVFTTVADDHKTLVGQAMVEFRLVVE